MPETCPNEAQHTPVPAGYMQWVAWAERMRRTHSQTQCPSCARYVIWRDDARVTKERVSE